MTGIDVEVSDAEPEQAVRDLVARGLDETVPADIAPWIMRPLAVVARAGGQVVGAVLGHIVWHWYEVRSLWIDETLRGRGFGRELMSRAEQEALARGCRYVRLDTASFQAPGFYRKCGYRQWGLLPDFPGPNARHWLVKPLADDPDPFYLTLPRAPVEVVTERLRLRPFRESDLDDLARLNANPDFARHVGGTKSRAESWRQLAMLIGHWQMRGYGWYAVTLKGGDDRLIGRIGHWYPEDWPELEIGWALSPDHWGQGLATEGARACLEIARDDLGLSSVVSLIHPENRASQRVAEKLGGTPERPFDLAGERVDIWRSRT